MTISNIHSVYTHWSGSFGIPEAVCQYHKSDGSGVCQAHDTILEAYPQ